MVHNLVRICSLSLILGFLPALFVSPASAAVSISIGTTNYGAGVASNVGVVLSGFNQDQDYQVTVKFVNTATNIDTSNGVLALTDTATLTLIEGYSFSNTATKLGFTGSYSRIAAALSTLTWNPSTASGDISMRIGIATKPGSNEFYDANSSRYYRYVSSALAWENARTAAESATAFGMRGYLAEINTEAENNFIANETTAPNIWVGATEDSATALSFAGSSFDGTTAGQRWIWEGATQTPLPTGSGASAGNTGNSVSGVFSRWATNEPNNDRKPGRDCGVTNWGSRGFWNDLACTTTNGYLIEFGGRPGETSTATTTTFTATVVSQVPSAPAAPTLNSLTPGDKRLTVAFTAGSTGGSVITDYEYSLNGGAYTSAGTTTSPFTITGLGGRTVYSITLKARNSVGLGAASSSLSTTTTDADRDRSERELREANDAIAARAAQAAANRELAERITIQPNSGASNGQRGNSATINGLGANAQVIVAPNVQSIVPGLVSISIRENTIEAIATETFSGRMVVPVTIADAGAITTLNITIFVNPKAVTSAETTPESRSQTNVTWQSSPNATSYKVMLNAKPICTSSSTTCSIPSILGPKSKLEVVALGNDGTVSSQVLPTYVPSKLIPVLDVKFSLGSSSISRNQIKKLNDFVSMMNEQGFTRVSITAFTDGVGGASGAKKLSTARAKSVARYLDRFLDVSLGASGKGIFSNARGSKSDANSRKAEVAVQ
jgi:outer membrane protein OmpA-like peptidoglycan-associated protein